MFQVICVLLGNDGEAGCTAATEAQCQGTRRLPVATLRRTRLATGTRSVGLATQNRRLGGCLRVGALPVEGQRKDARVWRCWIQSLRVQAGSLDSDR